MKHMQCIVSKNNISLFHHILRQGVEYSCQLPQSIKEFLLTELELTPQQVEDEIRTVFLDNSPVDNLEEALLIPDCVLALGTAMPGLVGITMACSSPFSSFRDDISAARHHAADLANSRELGSLRVKLFSFVADMCGSGILKKGVFVTEEKLRGLLGELENNLGRELEKHLVSLSIDGRTVPVRTFLAQAGPQPTPQGTKETPAHSATELIRFTCRETTSSEHHADTTGN
ncbi:MAG: hypothetical protein ACNI3A_09610 [Desulfovibrio sp.]|uniref:hypothetical protein n=1 Tax=Desulfovibrio sp. 7SRBS1 TaxID=3378064 RepID=UPI003B3E7981